MTTSPRADDAAAGPGAPPVENVPVNIARPNWACPHCATSYGTDLERATECAQAGPAPDVESGIPVLTFGTGVDSRPTLGVTEVGPVKAVNVDGRRTHERAVLVTGRHVDPERVAATPAGPGGLRVLPRIAPQYDAEPLLIDSATGVLRSIFSARPVSGYREQPAVTVWVSERRHRGDDTLWWRAPDESQRAALNVVTDGVIDRLTAVDEMTLAAAIRAAYAPSHHLVRGRLSAHGMGNPTTGLYIADAHGAPNHIWALRWLTAHLDDVASWQATTLKAWAAGHPDAIIPPVRALTAPDTLPRNPGKRRLAVMEPYGWDYGMVLSAIRSQLRVDPPPNPVPGLGDVETSIHALASAAANHHVTTTRKGPDHD